MQQIAHRIGAGRAEKENRKFMYALIRRANEVQLAGRACQFVASPLLRFAGRMSQFAGRIASDFQTSNDHNF